MSMPLSTATTGPNYGSVSLGALFPQASTTSARSYDSASLGYIYSLGIDALNPPGGPGVYIVSLVRDVVKVNGTNNSDIGWIVAIMTVHPTQVLLHQIQSNFGGSSVGILQNSTYYNLGSTSDFSATTGYLAFKVGGGGDSAYWWNMYMSKISIA